jgi:hypothetical protein
LTTFFAVVLAGRAAQIQLKESVNKIIQAPTAKPAALATPPVEEEGFCQLPRLLQPLTAPEFAARQIKFAMEKLQEEFALKAIPAATVAQLEQILVYQGERLHCARTIGFR